MQFSIGRLKKKNILVGCIFLKRKKKENKKNGGFVVLSFNKQINQTSFDKEFVLNLNYS